MTWKQYETMFCKMLAYENGWNYSFFFRVSIQ